MPGLYEVKFAWNNGETTIHMNLSEAIHQLISICIY